MTLHDEPVPFPSRRELEASGESLDLTLDLVNSILQEHGRVLRRHSDRLAAIEDDGSEPEIERLRRLAGNARMSVMTAISLLAREPLTGIEQALLARIEVLEQEVHELRRRA